MDIYTVLLYVLTFFAIMNLPISVSQPILLIITRHYRKIDFGDPVPGRKVIILIATVGKAYDVVKEIIADLKSMNTQARIMVLIEEYGQIHYGEEGKNIEKHRVNIHWLEICHTYM